MRVVVADDVMLTREGITRLLTDADIDVVGEAGDAVSLLRGPHDPARRCRGRYPHARPLTPTKASPPRSRSAPSIPISG
jgi:hypothetical protein